MKKKIFIGICSFVIVAILACSIIAFASNSKKEFLGMNGETYTVYGIDKSEGSKKQPSYKIGDDMENGYRVIGIADDGSILAEPIE